MPRYQLVIALLITEMVSNTVMQTSFGCKNALISDDWRTMVLNWHNNQRRKVAEGKQKTKGGTAMMPRAKDMWQLTWDCNLEHNAWLSICDQQVIVPDKYPKTEKATLGGVKTCNITEKTRSALKKWWDEAVKADLSVNPNYLPAEVKNFGRMATGAAKGFACTYNNCGTNANSELLCVYSEKVNDNDPLYTTAADDTQICQNCQNKCAYHLCSEPYTAVDDANPKSICAGNEDGMTYDMQQIALNAHNYYRSLIATGWAEDSKGYAPTSKKMQALTYDCANAGAQAKNQAHDCDKITTQQYTQTAGYAMSYMTFPYTVSEQDALTQAITNWYGQLKSVQLGDKAEFSPAVQTNAKYFANMAFGEATQIGCAAKTCTAQGRTVALCQYNKDPTGEDYLYEVGKPCSGCDRTTQKCDYAVGLCTAKNP